MPQVFLFALSSFPLGWTKRDEGSEGETWKDLTGPDSLFQSLKCGICAFLAENIAAVDLKMGSSAVPNPQVEWMHLSSPRSKVHKRFSRKVAPKQQYIVHWALHACPPKLSRGFRSCRADNCALQTFKPDVFLDIFVWAARYHARAQKWLIGKDRIVQSSRSLV